MRGLACLVVAAVVVTLLVMRYRGDFSDQVSVDAALNDIGDGLTSHADVRYNGYIVGSVDSVSLDVGAGEVATASTRKLVHMDLDPTQARGIPSNVTARTVPANLFGVNSVELIAPTRPSAEQISSGQTVPADVSAETIALQDAQNQLRTLLTAVPPADLASMLGALSDALRGGGATFGMFVGLLDGYWKAINAQFPDGAPSGFENFDDTMRGLRASMPKATDVFAKAIIPSVTLAGHQADLAAMLSAATQATQSAHTLFARNPNSAKILTADLSTVLGALTRRSDAIPQSLAALDSLAQRALGIFTGVNGRIQLNLGLSLTPWQQYTAANCAVYDGGQYGITRAPNCPAGATGGWSPSWPDTGSVGGNLGLVTTAKDAATVSAASGSTASAPETLMLGPLVRSIMITPAPSHGGRR